MLDDFLIRALVAGIGVALMAGPFGCVVIWRRMAYFGDTMAHAALLGIALSYASETPLIAGVFLVAVAAAVLLEALQRRGDLSADALLGILSHGTLALGLMLVGLMSWVRVDLMGALFGDILAVGWVDIWLIWGGGALACGLLALIWRPLLAATVSPDIARAEGLAPERTRLMFMVLMAVVIAVAMKVVGVLLITALLIIPAATARQWVRGPETMAVAASLTGVVAVILGLMGSMTVDSPSGPSIVTAAVLLFVGGLVASWLRPRRPKELPR